MRLIDGAEAIAGDIPAAATTSLDVLMEAGEALGTGVNRYSSLLAIRRSAEAARGEIARVEGEQTVLLIGGDCGADLAGIDHAAGENAGDLALVWFDAHADLNTPESSTTGAFGGMALRCALGEGADSLALPPARALRPQQVVLAGARAFDEPETQYVATAGIRTVDVEDLTTPDALLDALEATGASAVYVHVDLDVLDPALIEGVGYPEPFGISVDALTGAIRAVRARFSLAGAGIAGFAPSSPGAAGDDLGPILRILGALTAPLP